MTRIVLIEGDITDQQVDALVNAAHDPAGNEPEPGSDLEGAIARRGGPSIQRERDAQGPIEVGEAIVTGAGSLAARFVIHAASRPVGGAPSEEGVRSAVRASLVLAEREGCRTIALPAIGTGSGGLSMQRCAEVSLEEARRFAMGEDGTQTAPERRLEEIRFVLSGEPAFRIFEMVDDAARVEAQMRKLRGG